MFIPFLLVSMAPLAIANQYLGRRLGSTPTGWVTVEAYDNNEPTCAARSTAFAAYGIGICISASPTTSRSYSITSPGSSYILQFTNYSDHTCSTPEYTTTISFQNNNCILRTDLSPDDFDPSSPPYLYYKYAKYHYYPGSVVPVAPYAGHKISSYIDGQCGYPSNYKVFNLSFCFQFDVSSSGKYKCDGEVDIYGTGNCTDDVVFTDTTLKKPLNICGNNSENNDYRIYSCYSVSNTAAAMEDSFLLTYYKPNEFGLLYLVIMVILYLIPFLFYIIRIIFLHTYLTSISSMVQVIIGDTDQTSLQEKLYYGDFYFGFSSYLYPNGIRWLNLTPGAFEDFRYYLWNNHNLISILLCDPLHSYTAIINILQYIFTYGIALCFYILCLHLIQTHTYDIFYIVIYLALVPATILLSNTIHRLFKSCMSPYRDTTNECLTIFLNILLLITAFITALIWTFIAIIIFSYMNILFDDALIVLGEYVYNILMITTLLTIVSCYRHFIPPYRSCVGYTGNWYIYRHHTTLSSAAGWSGMDYIYPPKWRISSNKNSEDARMGAH